MDVSQMLAHCANAMEVASNEKQIKRTTMGYNLGGIFKKAFYNDRPFGKSSPTHGSFVIADAREFEKEKNDSHNCPINFSKADRKYVRRMTMHSSVN